MRALFARATPFFFFFFFFFSFSFSRSSFSATAADSVFALAPFRSFLPPLPPASAAIALAAPPDFFEPPDFFSVGAGFAGAGFAGTVLADASGAGADCAPPRPLRQIC